MRPEVRRFLIPGVIVAGLAVVLLVGALLHHHAAASVNKVALAASPKRVSVVTAVASSYRPTHRYVGTLRPWTEAKVGPQFIGTRSSEPSIAVTRRPGAGRSTCKPAACRPSNWRSRRRPSA